MFFTPLINYKALLDVAKDAMSDENFDEVTAGVAQILVENISDLDGNPEPNSLVVFGLCPRCKEIHGAMLPLDLDQIKDPDKLYFTLRKVGCDLIMDQQVAVLAAVFIFSDSPLSSTYTGMTIDGRINQAINTCDQDDKGKYIVSTTAMISCQNSLLVRRSRALAYFFRGVRDGYKAVGTGFLPWKQFMIDHDNAEMPVWHVSHAMREELDDWLN